ncbi:MAG: relaxase/mobilization nuclease domain-containing protein [Sphingobacterium sp.]
MMSHLIKILSTSASFAGVGYNMSKVQKGDAELVCEANFGALSLLEPRRASDYIHYLQMIAKGNPRVIKPQLHAVLCVQGKSQATDKLPEIAERWLWGMGYRKQPYLIFAHNDTPNDHLHILSVRVKKNGDWIDPGLEWIRTRKVLNEILGINVPQLAREYADQALDYSFDSPERFVRILEAKGFFMLRRREQLLMCYYGKAQHSIPLSLVQQRSANYRVDTGRMNEVRRLFLETKKLFSPSLTGKSQLLPGRRASKFSGYTSKMAIMLEQKLGIEIIFHNRKGCLPHDYTIIDPKNRAVYSGAELMPLHQFTRADDLHATIQQQTQYSFER